MKKLNFISWTALVIFTLLFSACESDNNSPSVGAADVKAKIMIISDVHYFDPSLLINDGVAFQTYLANDRKLLTNSKAITKSVINSIKEAKPDILLIPGDLTKDGEEVCHKNLKLLLDELKQENIQVLVINGNHDINNKDAKSYDGDNSTDVHSVTPDEFKSIWNDYGYSQAIARDENSLSYVSEPVEGLRILALDVCKYNPQATGGVLKEQTLEWALLQIEDAKANNKAIFGMMHHGLIEHYAGQAQFFPEYLLDNYQEASAALQNAGLEIMFTGHYHANDIAEETINGSKIYDIETGSTVTWPCPYRTILVNGKNISITTDHVEQIEGTDNFSAYAKSYAYDGLNILATNMFMSPPYGLPEESAKGIAPYFANGFLAHYMGDETPTAENNQAITNISQINQTAGAALKTIWTDLVPADNTLTIKLK